MKLFILPHDSVAVERETAALMKGAREDKRCTKSERREIIQEE